MFRYKGWVPDGGEPGADVSVYAEKVGAPEAGAYTRAPLSST